MKPLFSVTLVALMFCLAISALAAPSTFTVRADFDLDGQTDWNVFWEDGNSPWQVSATCLGGKFPEVQVGKGWQLGDHIDFGLFGVVWPQTTKQDEELFLAPTLDLSGKLFNADAAACAQWYLPIYQNGPDALFTDLTMKWPIGDALKAGFDIRKFHCGGGNWRYGPVASYKLAGAQFSLAYLNKPSEIRLGLTLK